MNKKIVLWNKVEVKLLSISLGVIFIFSSILLTCLDIYDDGIISTGLLIALGGMALFIFLVIFFVGRYRIIFDFENRVILKRPYFTLTKQYSFDDVQMRIKETISDHGSLLHVDYIFYVKGKKILKLDEFNFEEGTNDLNDILNEFLEGSNKTFEKIKDNLIKNGFEFIGISFIDNHRKLYLVDRKNNTHISIEEENWSFHIICEKFDVSSTSIKSTILKDIHCSMGEIEDEVNEIITSQK